MYKYIVQIPLSSPSQIFYRRTSIILSATHLNSRSEIEILVVPFSSVPRVSYYNGYDHVPFPSPPPHSNISLCPVRSLVCVTIKSNLIFKDICSEARSWIK